MAKVLKILMLIVTLAYGMAALGMHGVSGEVSPAYALTAEDGSCESCNEAVSHEEAVCTLSCPSAHVYLTGSFVSLTARLSESERLLPPPHATLANWKAPVDPRPPRS